MPILFMCYAFYYIDKTTLSYAALYGIKKDLKLGKTDYSTLGSIFYLGWLAWAVPGESVNLRTRVRCNRPSRKEE
jgi:sugar phosphate permease